jgi:hypothetical protein
VNFELRQGAGSECLVELFLFGKAFRNEVDSEGQIIRGSALSQGLESLERVCPRRGAR